MKCAAALISSAVLFCLSGTVEALTSSLVCRKLKTSSTYNAPPPPLFHLARSFAPPSPSSGPRVAFFFSADLSRAPSNLSQSYKQTSPLAFNTWSLPTSVWKHCGNLRHSTVFSHLFIPSLIYRSLFVYPPLFCPLAFSLLTLRGEMRHAGNLLADNGGQLLSLLKPFMSWISSASLPCSLPPHLLLALTPIQTY